jgi:hypothetical protein
MAAHRIPLQDFRNFVDRKDPESRQDTSKKLKQLLLKDIQLSISQKGRHILPTTIEFNFGSFAMATKIKAAVIPIAIDYKVKTDAFVDDDTFIPHFIKCFGKRHTEIK